MLATVEDKWVKNLPVIALSVLEGSPDAWHHEILVHALVDAQCFGCARFMGVGRSSVVVRMGMMKDRVLVVLDLTWVVAIGGAFLEGVRLLALQGTRQSCAESSQRG